MNAALVSVALAVATSSCGGITDYAPQTPDPSPAAVLPMTVELIIDGSRPKCTYRVLGSVFALDAENGLEALRERAALEGATGVYDIDCKSSERTTMFGSAVTTVCAGRVYVCGAAKEPDTKEPAAKEPDTTDTENPDTTDAKAGGA